MGSPPKLETLLSGIWDFKTLLEILSTVGWKLLRWPNSQWFHQHFPHFFFSTLLIIHHACASASLLFPPLRFLILLWQPRQSDLWPSQGSEPLFPTFPNLPHLPVGPLLPPPLPLPPFLAPSVQVHAFFSAFFSPSPSLSEAAPTVEMLPVVSLVVFSDSMCH